MPKIRIATKNDLQNLLALRSALWPEQTDEENQTETMRVLNSPDKIGPLVSEDDQDNLLGFIEVSLRSYAEGCETSLVGYIEGWYVVDKARRQGIGEQLVRAAEDWARAKGCTEMASDAVIDNHLSHTAHQCLGYEIVERIVCFRKSLGPEIT